MGAARLTDFNLGGAHQSALNEAGTVTKPDLIVRWAQAKHWDATIMFLEGFL